MMGTQQQGSLTQSLYGGGATVALQPAAESLVDFSPVTKYYTLVHCRHYQTNTTVHSSSGSSATDIQGRTLMQSAIVLNSD